MLRLYLDFRSTRWVVADASVRRADACLSGGVVRACMLAETSEVGFDNARPPFSSCTLYGVDQ